MVHLRVLGSLEAEVDGAAVPLGGPRQRAVLAILVTARGRIVSVDRIIDDLWGGDPPGQAVTSVQAYVSNLRRLLEPGRPPRTAARLLVSSPPGYALRLPPDAVDAWRFERLARSAQDHAATDPATARALAGEALALWRGPAFAAVADEAWAAGEIARLDELRLAAREAHIAAGLRCGDAPGAVTGAEQLVRDAPLREEGWRLHALALWAGRRQADALATLRRARAVLADDVGLDPGPALVALEEAILAQRMDVLTAATSVPGSSAGRSPSRPAPAGPAPAAVPHDGEGLFVGRDAELGALMDTAAQCPAGGTRIALVAGEAGQGKSALLGRLGARLAREGWLVATGRCPETADAPPAWAWTQALAAVAADAPPPDGAAQLLAPLLDDGTGAAPAGPHTPVGSFRLHRAVWSWLAGAARQRPVAILLDDLHWADTESLALLLSGVEGEPPFPLPAAPPPLLLVAAYRPDEAEDRLTEALAALARRSPLRLALGGLPREAVARLVEEVSESPVSGETVAALTERTGGNPFYVRESARLLGSEGELVALSDVPEGVRDVLRRRFARLPQVAVAVLRLAAVAGHESDVDVLVDAADAPEADVLDALETGLIAGLLTEPAPGRVRFTHTLVRETLSADLTGLRRGRLHARIAAALERCGTGDVSALAYHYSRAATPATASRAVELCVGAAEVAERRYAHAAAADLLTRAWQALDRAAAGRPDADADRVHLLGRLLRAQVAAADVAGARTTRQRAVDLAQSAGRDDLLVAALTAWTEPSPWQSRSYGTSDRPLVATLARLLERGDTGASDRCRLLDAYAAELAGEGEPERARAAAQEAAELAASLDDPELRALTLVTLTRSLAAPDQAARRAAAADELTAIGDSQDVPVHRWWGRFNRAFAAADLGDPQTARRLVRESGEIAHAYRMSGAIGVNAYADAALAHLAGRTEEAERLYADAGDSSAGQGSLHAAVFRWLATATLRLGQGRIGELAPLAEPMTEAGPFLADVAALALATAGRVDEARAMRGRAVPIRADFLHTLLSTFRALAVVALAERDTAAALYPLLLPLRDAPPVCAGFSLALRPMAHTLGDLAVLLDRPAEAAEHFAHATAIAERWEAAAMAAAARAAARAAAPAARPA